VACKNVPEMTYCVRWGVKPYVFTQSIVLSCCMSGLLMYVSPVTTRATLFVGAVKVWDPRQKDNPVAVMEPADGDDRRDCWAIAFGQTFHTRLFFNHFC